MVPGPDDRPEDQASTLRTSRYIGHGHDRADCRESDAHHDGKANPEPLGNTERLDQRDDAAGEQIRRYQECHVLGRKLQRPTDDQGHGNGAGVHDEHVLEAKRGKLRKGQDFIHRMGRNNL